MTWEKISLIYDAKAVLAEGPVWDSEERELYWVDILAGTFCRLDPVAGTVRVEPPKKASY